MGKYKELSENLKQEVDTLNKLNNFLLEWKNEEVTQHFKLRHENQELRLTIEQMGKANFRTRLKYLITKKVPIHKIWDNSL